MIIENQNKYVSIWLLLITFLIGLMIVIGGLTRLTDSGLSITRWDLFMGIVPPLNFKDWNIAFSLYKEIPEYKIINSEMTLEQFKIIYLWEYIHRLLGRIVGIFYIVPLIFFSFKNNINLKNLIYLYFIFFLICFQGFVGWYMVSSGLTERTDVSHYRLSLHLTMAFIIMIMVVWNFLILNRSQIKFFKKPLSFFPIVFLFLILIQISVGALVSGLDAGQIYQSWPLMGNNYFPDDSNLSDLYTYNAFEIPSIVQFIHRNLAYLILLVFIYIYFLTIKNKKKINLKPTVLLILFFLTLQIILGILTILSGAQIILASMHQIGSIFLVISSTILIYKNSMTN
jgi:heme a synthase